MSSNEEKEENKNTTENELLEMSNHFKTVVEEKELILNKMKDKYITTKKQIARCYGLIIELQEYLDDIPLFLNNEDDIIDFITNSIRTICSNVLFKTEIIELDIDEL